MNEQLLLLLARAYIGFKRGHVPSYVEQTYRDIEAALQENSGLDIANIEDDALLDFFGATVSKPEPTTKKAKGK